MRATQTVNAPIFFKKKKCFVLCPVWNSLCPARHGFIRAWKNIFRPRHFSEYTRVLNMPVFWICLIIPEYASICRNTHEYAEICLTGFSFTFPHCNPLSTWMHGYLFQRLHKIRSSMKKNETVFLKRQNLIFFLLQLEVFDLFFCFRLNIFTRKISKLVLPLGAVAANLDQAFI